MNPAPDWKTTARALQAARTRLEEAETITGHARSILMTPEARNNAQDAARAAIVRAVAYLTDAALAVKPGETSR